MTISLDTYASKGEARVARKLVRAALDSGFALSVWDSEEWTVKRSRNRDEVLAALATTGQDSIRLHAEDFTWTIVLIFGNDPSGEELIADYSAKSDASLDALTAWLDRNLES